MASSPKRAPFQDTLLAQPAWARVGGLAGLAAFWLTVAWAVSGP